jgi:hypothetical protein
VLPAHPEEAVVSDEPKLPVIDEERVNSVFSELEGMEVHLDPDPLAYGPRRLNSKVAKARSMLTRCERVFLQTSHDLQICKTAHRTSQLDFDLQMQDLIANDPEVRAGSNVRDRDAIATMKLRNERLHLMGMEISIGDLEMVMTVIKAKRADLRDIQGRIRDQIKLCQEEIGLGGKWGSRAGPGEDTPDLDNAPQTDPRALASIQDLVREAGSDEVDEVHLTEGSSEWMEGEDSDADVDDVLAAVAEAVAVAEEESEAEEVVRGLAEDTIVMDDASVLDPEPEPEPEVTKGAEVDMDELFGGGGAGDGGDPIPPVESDADVDDIFDRIDTAAPMQKKAPSAASPAADDLDLDNLIDMFGEDS